MHPPRDIWNSLVGLLFRLSIQKSVYEINRNGIVNNTAILRQLHFKESY